MHRRPPPDPGRDGHISTSWSCTEDPAYTRGYARGPENQLGVLGLVLNFVVLWTTVYLDAAVRQLKMQGFVTG
ncbi:hypothetical protein EJK15_29890 [Nonomuraea basaltis]|nr:hypothetical protein EJK15_29890 [Nonomuraea basaltis]